MSDIRIERRLRASPAVSFGLLGEILRAIAAQNGPWEGYGFHANLAEAGLPDVGYLTIPIVLSVSPPPEGVRQYAFAVRARRHPEAFPAFEGCAGIDGSGTSGASLWISGSYEVPAGVAGKAINATLLRGLAHHVLEHFATDLERAVDAAYEKRESEFARYRFFAH